MAGTGGNLKGVPREILPGVRVYPNPPKWRARRRGCSWTMPGSRLLARPVHGRAVRRQHAAHAVRIARLRASSAARWTGPRCTFSGATSAPFRPTIRTAITAWRGANCFSACRFPQANVHRMEAEKPNIGRAAHEYEEVLRKHLELDDRGFPRFHLIFLGMGADGHTASLFPGTRVTRQTSRWVSTPMVAKLNARRMTLTLPVLDAALRVVFLVVGSEKAEILRAVLDGKAEPPYPAQLVQPRDNGLKLFLVDRGGWRFARSGRSAACCLATRKPAGTTRGKPGEHVILAGDIGGTKCNLALVRISRDGLSADCRAPLRKPELFVL